MTCAWRRSRTFKTIYGSSIAVSYNLIRAPSPKWTSLTIADVSRPSVNQDLTSIHVRWAAARVEPDVTLKKWIF